MQELTLHPPMIDVNGPVQRIESDENGSADKISPCKLNEGSVDNHRIQKVHWSNSCAQTDSVKHLIHVGHSYKCRN